MSEKTTIQAIVSENDGRWVIRNSVTFRELHRTFIEHPPTFGGVHASPPICSDLVIRPNQYAEKRPDIFRDAEVVGSNPTVPTTKVLVRGSPTCPRPAPLAFHRASIPRPDSGRAVRLRFMMDTVAPVGGRQFVGAAPVPGRQWLR